MVGLTSRILLELVIGTARGFIMPSGTDGN
jgi:hypothetical protein